MIKLGFKKNIVNPSGCPPLDPPLCPPIHCEINRFCNMKSHTEPFKEEIHTRILKNLKEREKYSLQNSAKMMKIG